MKLLNHIIDWEAMNRETVVENGRREVILAGRVGLR